MSELEIMGRLATDAKHITAGLKINEKNNALLKIADLIVERTDYIIEESKKDMEITSPTGSSSAATCLTPSAIPLILSGVSLSLSRRLSFIPADLPVSISFLFSSMI